MEPEICRIKAAVSGKSAGKLNGHEIITGTLCGKDVVAACTGVGKVLTALSLQYLADHFKPSAVIMSGIAGSVNPNLGIGDMVLGTGFIQHDFDATAAGFERGRIPYSDFGYLEADSSLIECALKWKGETLRTGVVLTGDQFISDAGNDETMSLFRQLNGDIVDMEGAAAAITAAVNGIPFMMIRIISDLADGKIKKSFGKFVKLSSERNLKLIQYILENI